MTKITLSFGMFITWVVVLVWDYLYPFHFVSVDTLFICAAITISGSSIADQLTFLARSGGQRSMSDTEPLSPD